MATSLLSGTTPASAQSVSGPCTVGARGDSVFDGAEVVVLASIYGDTADYYENVYNGTINESKPWVNVDIQGDYHLKTTIHKTGSNTVVNVGFNQ